MKLKTLSTLILIFSFTFSFSQNVDIKVNKLTDNISMIIGQGGNIGIYEGTDDLLMIDSQFGRISELILASIKGISQKPISILLNTHHHGDHTGGNANIAAEGAAIYAQQNVRKRLLESIEKDGKPDESALPILTFSDELNLFLDETEVFVFHPEAAHTDTDAIIYFVKENVLHTGDVFFNGRYPYIDLNSGGDVLGAKKAIELTLMLINNETQIIPGHGKLGKKADLQKTLEMYNKSISRVSAEIEKGQTEDQVAKNETLTKDMDADFFSEGAFISPEKWRRTVYLSLKK